MSLLTQNAYGKSRVRLTKVTRHPDRHDLKEIAVDVMLEGDFAASYSAGDNSKIVATDTMKNTVYVLARDHPLDSIETFGIDLAAHFVDRYEQVEAAVVYIGERAWSRIQVGGDPHATAFVGGSDEKRVCSISRIRGESARVEAGIEDLRVLKTTQSSFSGFVRDTYTTLPEAEDRILATSVTARWRYYAGSHDWNALHRDIRQAMLDVFARHHSRSVQQTLQEMGRAALDACRQISEVTLELPNSHHLLVNLEPFGLDNPNVIFVPTDEPYGIISGTIARSGEA